MNSFWNQCSHILTENTNTTTISIIEAPINEYYLFYSAFKKWYFFSKTNRSTKRSWYSIKTITFSIIHHILGTTIIITVIYIIFRHERVYYYILTGITTTRPKKNRRKNEMRWKTSISRLYTYVHLHILISISFWRLIENYERLRNVLFKVSKLYYQPPIF